MASTAPHQNDAVASSLLDALSICAVVVDAGRVVRLASVAGAEALRRPGSSVALLPAPPGAPGAFVLAARHKEDAALLRNLVASAAQGGNGGSLRLRGATTEDGSETMQVACVTPLPSATGLALVKIEDLVRRAVPPTAMLCGLFDFSPAEADVARRLVGGSSAEGVALDRAVSLDTVRGQIRAILRKSEAANLRDFERLMATLAAIGGSDRPIGMAA